MICDELHGETAGAAAIAPPEDADAGLGEPYFSPAPQTKACRNIPAGESDESSADEVTVQDPTHPLFGRPFRVIRRSVHRGGGFPISYEVEYGEAASLLIPVAVTEPQNWPANRTKLSIEALQDLISVAEQLENHADKAGRPLDHVAAKPAAPNRRGSRRSAGGGVA